MTQSESIAKLCDAMSKAQAELPAVAFDSNNPFAGNRFASLGAVISTARPVLAKHGLALMQFACSNEQGWIGVRTRLSHCSGEWIQDEIYMEIFVDKDTRKSKAQIVGSIITYLRRYSQSALLNLYADEDTDGNAPSHAPESRPTHPVSRPSTPHAAPTKTPVSPPGASGKANGPALPVPSDPEKQALKCKARFLQVIADNKWGFYAWHYALAQGWILPTERLEDGSPTKFPQSAGDFAKAEEGIKAMMDKAASGGGVTQEQQEAYDQAHMPDYEPSDNDGGPDYDHEDWMDVVLHFGPDKGKRLIEIDRKKLWGWCKSYEPKPFKGKINDADIALRDALDEALSWMEENNQ